MPPCGTRQRYRLCWLRQAVQLLPHSSSRCIVLNPRLEGEVLGGAGGGGGCSSLGRGGDMKAATDCITEMLLSCS